METSIKEAREHFRTMLEQVASGEEVIITRRGKAVARILPPLSGRPAVPDLSAFRESLEIQGESLRTALQRNREEERY